MKRIPQTRTWASAAVWSRERAATRPRWTIARIPWQLGIALCLIVVILGVGDVVRFAHRPQDLYRIHLGSGTDLLLIDGVLKTEKQADGATYRWTTGHTTFKVREFAAVPHPLLELNIGGFPSTAPATRQVQLTLDDTPLAIPVTSSARRYQVQLPQGALLDGSFTLQMDSETTVVPPDPRALGIRLDDISLGWDRDAWVLPGWELLLVQAAIVGVWLALAWCLQLPGWCGLLLAGGLSLLLPATITSILPFAHIWNIPLLTYGVVLLLLTATVFPWLRRAYQADGTRLDPRWLGVIVVAAISLRLWTILYPLFGTHDLLIHRQRLLNVQYGTLQLFDSPSEFAGRQAVVPPALYVMVSPLTLLFPDAGAAIQGVFTLLEGTGILLIAIIVRDLGGSWRAATVAALVLACIPIELTALWWGFAPQIVGQWLILLLAMLICRPGRVGWTRGIIATIALAIALLMHDGVPALGGLWLALYLGLSWQKVGHRDHNWRAWLSIVVVASVIAGLLLYLDIIGQHLQEVATSASTPQPFTTSERLALLWGGLQSSFRPIGAFGAAALFAAVVAWTRGVQRRLIIAWLLSTGVFLLIDIASGLQVRYGYFVTPVLCIGVALLLDRIMARGRWGTLVGWSLVGVIIALGSELWIEGVFLSIKPTLTALTH